MSDEPNVSMSVHTMQGVNDVNPKTIQFTAADIAAILTAGTQFVLLIQKIKAEQTDAWQAVATDFQAAHNAWEQASGAFHNDANELPLGTAQSAPMGPAEVPPGSVADAQQ